jgi:glutathione S-transferase
MPSAMPMKLYYVPATRAGRPRWLLEELGVPYELVRLDPKQKENRQPEYLALNPTGHVPTLVDDSAVLFESAAICLYLADKFPEKRLAPAPAAPERARYLQWILYAVTEIEAPVAQIERHTSRLPEEKRLPALVELEKGRLAANLASLRPALVDKEYLFGDWFTAADVMLASVLGWAKVMRLLGDEPVLEAYVRRCVGRPAAKRSRAD